MRLIALTQYMENYGDTKNPYWKFKGGHEYEVARLSYQEIIAMGSDGLKKLVDERMLPEVYFSEYTENYLVDWFLLEDNEFTHDEKLQMEFEGKIIYPIRVLWKEKEVA